MENFKAFSCLSVVFASMLILLVISVNAQISTPCTSSMVTSFTPCLNFITGSTGSGGSPTADCCDSLQSLTSGGMDCACLIITGNVPFSLPINQTLAISLPRACKSSGVPIRCKAAGVPLPAPGPVLFGPTPPPSAAASPSFSPSPRASKASAFAPASPPAETTSDIAPASPPAETTSDITPASPPAETTSDITPASPPAETTSDVTPANNNSRAAPTASPRIRPVLNPTSASNPSYNNASPFFLLGFLGIMLVNYN